VADAPEGTNLPREVEQYLDAFDGRISEILSDDLVGSYVHGSAVLGSFNPARSDLDVLVVIRNALSGSQRDRICERLGAAALPVPASMLEMSVVTADTCRNPTSSPQFELHLNTRDNRCADGTGRTDGDLVLHFAVARQSGRLIGSGRSPGEVFAPVPEPLILAAMAMELDDAMNSSSAAPEYIVLNACRNLAYSRTGHIHSKVSGAEWVLAHEPDVDRGLVDSALRRQQGDPTASAPPDPIAVRALAVATAQELKRCRDLQR
jgi:hypothetical protein